MHPKFRGPPKTTLARRPKHPKHPPEYYAALPVTPWVYVRFASDIRQHLFHRPVEGKPGSIAGDWRRATDAQIEEIDFVWQLHNGKLRKL